MDKFSQDVVRSKFQESNKKVFHRDDFNFKYNLTTYNVMTKRF